VTDRTSDVVAAGLAAVRARIARAAARAGRDPSDVRLIAVSKTFPLESVLAAAAAGQRDFGENRVQEALQKQEALQRTGPSADTPLEWHLIGHLQSNKARRAAGAFACIHSVDSADLLRRLDAAAAETGVRQDVLVQVDLAGEATKFGAATDEAERIVEAGAACRAVRVRGLMLLPPWFDDPEMTRPFFRRLVEFRDRLLARGVPAPMLRELSMGMSHDLEVAIEEGATMVRVGTAIFGARS
jgi:pyridoxal phosphate enzyme (YggS family)